MGLLIYPLPRRRWAFPHSTYRRGSPVADAATLSTLLTSSAAVAVVAGYPVPTPGGISPAADVDAYVTALVVSGLGGAGGGDGIRAVALADERWSSVRAREALGVGVGTGQGGRGGGWRTWRGGARRAKEAVDAVRLPARRALQPVLFFAQLPPFFLSDEPLSPPEAAAGIGCHPQRARPSASGGVRESDRQNSRLMACHPGR